MINWKRFLLETAALIAAAALCATISNALASRERRLVLPGSYPNATTVPARLEQESMPRPAGPVPAPAAPSVPALPAPTPAPSVSTARAPANKAAAPAAAPADMKLRFPSHKDKPYVELGGDDVAWLHGHGALFLDARRSAVYAEGHVAGARGVSVWESDVDEKVTALVNEGRDTDAPVVIYCSGGDCEDSHMLAEKLFGAGFNNLLVYRDGWPDWQKRGGPGRTGSQP